MGLWKWFLYLWWFLTSLIDFVPTLRIIECPGIPIFNNLNLLPGTTKNSNQDHQKICKISIAIKIPPISSLSQEANPFDLLYGSNLFHRINFKKTFSVCSQISMSKSRKNIHSSCCFIQKLVSKTVNIHIM